MNQLAAAMFVGVGAAMTVAIAPCAGAAEKLVLEASKQSVRASAVRKNATTLRSTRTTVRSTRKPTADFSGKRRLGKASFYADWFAGRKMANGAPMNPHGDNAASRTLPLGTVAKVTNLETGKSAVVSIQDRGPYVDGRIVDLSPTTARKIGLTQRQGIVRVAVAPIVVPLPNGEVKPGVAAHEAEGG